MSGRAENRDRGRTSWAAVLLLVAAVPLAAWVLGSLSDLSPRPRLDPDLGVPIGEALCSLPVEGSLVVDGRIDAAWAQAPVLAAPLHYGLHGDEPAGTLELRSLHDDDRVYFLARWMADSPGGEPDVWRNLATVHWRLVDPGLVSGESTASPGLACTVGCHTATASEAGQLIGIRSETIPPGLDEDLPAGGGWQAGTWLLEWSRPKISPSPYDQNLDEPDQPYRFFVKLFLGREGRPDLLSDVHELRLEP